LRYYAFLLSVMGRFDGKVVIVTGSSAGIGQDAVLAFGREGASVTIHGRNPEGLAETEKFLKEAGVPSERILTVTGAVDEETVPAKIIDETVAKFGRIDVLVNNAGALGIPGVDKDSLENFDFIIKVNLRSVIELTQRAMHFLEKTKGNVMNVSSNASMCAFTDATFYTISKAALDHYTRNASLKYGPNVRINAVNPGPVTTAIFDKYGVEKDKQENFFKWVGKTSALNRGGVPREITSILLFLASTEASYVTGACWVADGGHMHFTLPVDFR
jgi:NAD(P)-dependent dehydrogenase (short-subunit alcohol dehydrogenase family)